MSVKKITPTQDRILVRRIDSESKTAGGIIIPDSAKEKPSRGIILAVGEGTKCEKTGSLCPLSLKVGQEVVFTKWSGTEIKVDSEDLLIMKESDVLATVES